MTIVLLTNYAAISYDVDTELTKEELAAAFADGSVLLTLKTGSIVMINPDNVVSLEIKDTPHMKKTS